MSTDVPQSGGKLEPQACWALLRTSEVGRIAVVVDGLPDIFPVNFVVDHGTVVLRTGQGKKLAAALDAPAVAFEAVRTLELAARDEQARLIPVDPAHRDDVRALLAAASQQQNKDEALLESAAPYAGVDRDARTGVPRGVLGPIPYGPDADDAPVRDLSFGTARHSRGHAAFEGASLIAVLMTSGDDRPSWLRAGQALERVLLTATARGLRTGLLMQGTEVPALRTFLADRLAVNAVPQAVLRLGYGEQVTPTPRLPVDEVLSMD